MVLGTSDGRHAWQHSKGAAIADNFLFYSTVYTIPYRYVRGSRKVGEPLS